MVPQPDYILVISGNNVRSISSHWSRLIRFLVGLLFLIRADFWFCVNVMIFLGKTIKTKTK